MLAIIFIILLCLSLLAWVLRIVGSYAEYRSNPKLPIEGAEALLPDVVPKISVIVPARNEERDIESCVKRLLSQDYANFEIIVIDDRSTDCTPQILAEIAKQDQRLKVVNGKELPDDWFGKPHAIWQGVAQADGEWLLLLDADVEPASSLLTQVTAYATQHNTDAVTVLPHLHSVSFWEQVIQPFLTLIFVEANPISKVNDPKQSNVLVNGKCIFVKKEAYLAVGGHEAVKTNIIEDHGLAKNLKTGGYNFHVVYGLPLVHVRMYTSLAEIWEGWSKNFFAGLENKFGLAVAFAMGIFTISTGPFLLLPIFGTWSYLVPGNVKLALITVLLLLQCCVIIVHRVIAARRLWQPVLSALAHPLAAVMVTAIILNSAYRIKTGKGVTWKGRVYLQQ